MDGQIILPLGLVGGWLDTSIALTQGFYDFIGKDAARLDKRAIQAGAAAGSLFLVLLLLLLAFILYRKRKTGKWDFG